MKKQPSDFPRPTHAEIDILHDFGMLGSCSDWESMYEEAMYGWEDEVERRYKEQEDSSALRDVGGVIRGMFYAGFGVSPPEEEEAERQ